MKFVKLSIVALSLGVFVTSCGGGENKAAEGAATTAPATTEAAAPAPATTPAPPAGDSVKNAGPAKDTTKKM